MAFGNCFRSRQKYTSTLLTDQNHPLDGCFDCNICLDFVQDPVVTLCGHLYCWPCIYKWFHIQSASLASDEYPQCPVCKAEISHTTVVPLYGRGHAPGDIEQETKAPNGATFIPPRPPACGTRALLNAASQPRHQLQYRNPYQGQPYNIPSFREQEDMVLSRSLLNQGNGPVTNVLQPVAEMVREILYARMFGASQNLYTYPNSYYLVGSDSPRSRRQDMQAEKSLYRVSMFLLCCFILCLIFF